MVVVGAARGRSGAGSGGVVGGGAMAGDEGRVCSVAWQRQHVHHQQHSTKTSIKQAAHGGEILPVVELKPFTRKVWRREKSLPNFYERPVGPKDDNSAETTRNTNNNVPPPDIVRFIRELSEQRKTVDTRQSVDSTQRYRSKLHPKTDFSFEGWCIAEHQQDLIPSFISRQERTKTCLVEDINGSAAPAPTPATNVNAGGSVTDRPVGNVAGAMLGREVSNLMAAYVRDKPLQQQQVCLTGDKLSMANIGRRQLTYLNPFSAYRQKQAWHVLRSENSPPGPSPRHNVSMAVSTRGSGTLQVSANDHARPDLVLSGSSFLNPERALLQPLKPRNGSPHKFNNKLGAARDSLAVLSRTGAPTVLEKNLSFDQEIRLERCRRERSFAAVGDTNVLSSAHYVAYDSQPTLGEMNLKKAREANKPNEGGVKTIFKRNGLQKPLPVSSFSHNLLGRVYENSPRSLKSELGDSGILSSLEDTTDMAARAGHTVMESGILPRDMIEDAIPDHRGKNEQFKRKSVEKQSTWVPEKSVAVLETDDKDNLVECTEEYRRPLSDTAATEAVHVRNEETPMSAENRARLLPRDDSLVAGESDRAQTSNRQRRQGFVKESDQTVEVDRSSVQEHRLTHDESGAEVLSKDTVVGESIANGVLAPKENSEQFESQRLIHEPNGNIASDLMAPEADSKAPTDNNEAEVQKVIPADTVFTMARSNSRGETVEAGTVRKLALDSVSANGGQVSIANDIELISANSSAPSFGNIDSARHPTDHVASSDHNSHVSEVAGGQKGDGAEKTSGFSLGQDGSSGQDAARGTGNEQRESHTSGQQHSVKPGVGVDQEKPQDGKTLEQSPTKVEQGVESHSMEKSTQVEKQHLQQSLSLALGAETSSQQLDILDSERNVAKTSRPTTEENGRCKEEGAAGRKMSEQMQPPSRENSEIPSATPTLNSGEGKGEAPVSKDKLDPSSSSSFSLSSDLSKAGDDKGHAQAENKNGVESIVTVTMDTVAKGDNFDGSKTFLTTTNVEPEEWQNMVKV